MQRKTKVALAAATTAGALGAMLFVPGQLAFSADHLDPPSVTDPGFAGRTTPADVACDIADDYAWHDDNFLYIAHTFGGPSVLTLPAFYDRNVLQTINISNNAPATSADIAIRFRFGPGANAGETGISVENLPGVNGALVGPVEQILTKDGVRVYAGLRDDPFFFDGQGLRESRATPLTTPPPQGLRFVNTRSGFFGRNITAVVLEIPRSRIGAGPLDISSTCARFQGTTP